MKDKKQPSVVSPYEIPRGRPCTIQDIIHHLNYLEDKSGYVHEIVVKPSDIDNYSISINCTWELVSIRNNTIMEKQQIINLAELQTTINGQSEEEIHKFIKECKMCMEDNN